MRDKELFLKAGIITFTYGDNYGQRLQNLAVQEILKSYFKEVYTIKQLPPKGTLKTKLRALKKILKFGLKSHIRRHRAFENFDKNFINYFELSISDETSDCFYQNHFDYFIAGSDQIWSPFSPDVNSTMFLTFADKAKRIALSPSIAAETIPEELKDKYKKYFEGFSYLSVRENKGAEIIKELTGIDAEVLIDPTLMHKATFWDKYIKSPKSMTNDKYALCYFLGTPQRAEKIDEICRINKLKRIDVLTEKKYKILGPQEFLYLIKNASVVITDSYHGCIFSCIFHVPFIMCEREGTNLNMNSRFATLFNKLGIIDRGLQEVEVENALCVDFSTIEIRLGLERARMKRYLGRAFIAK